MSENEFENVTPEAEEVVEEVPTEEVVEENEVVDEITEENALDLIFSGYRGNFVKKAISEAIRRHSNTENS